MRKSQWWPVLLTLGLLACKPTASQSQSPPAPISATLPMCATHDPTRYHALVDTTRGCHYDHEHKGDPHAVNDVFGPVGAWFGSTQEISYPWQTFHGASEGHGQPSGAGLSENDLKHNGYGWGVRKGLECKPASGAQGCLTDIRMQVHALPTVHDAIARFHSYSLEVRGCIGQRCGIAREGGWTDYGKLKLDEGQPYEIAHLPLPGDPVNQTSFNPRCIHKTVRNQYQRDATWYTQGGLWNQHLAWIGLRFESWTPLDPQQPSKELNYCELEGSAKGDCQWNGSWLEVHLIPLHVPAAIDAQDGQTDGLVSFKGFTDRYGKIVTGCTKASLDCVPLILERMPVGVYQYRDDHQGITAPDHDVSPGMHHQHDQTAVNPGPWWIRYPEYRAK